MAPTTFPPSADSARGIRYDLTTAVVYIEATRAVVDLRGEWDVSTRPVLSDQLSRVIAIGAGDVVIDLAEVTFIDTATVRALATAQHMLDRVGRRLTIRSPTRLANQVLHLFGLAELIETRE